MIERNWNNASQKINSISIKTLRISYDDNINKIVDIYILNNWESWERHVIGSYWNILFTPISPKANLLWAINITCKNLKPIHMEHQILFLVCLRDVTKLNCCKIKVPNIKMLSFSCIQQKSVLTINSTRRSKIIKLSTVMRLLAQIYVHSFTEQANIWTLRHLA